jgi:glyoxylase-like metal-dependent hydrolase (beta-lactamase superfamily II)
MRTIEQNGDPGAQHDSLFEKLLNLPEDTLVYPAHDYEGRTSGTISAPGVRRGLARRRCGPARFMKRRAVA